MKNIYSLLKTVHCATVLKCNLANTLNKYYRQLMFFYFIFFILMPTNLNIFAKSIKKNCTSHF